MRNPNWTKDELILATVFYRKHAPRIPGRSTSELIELSKDIRNVALALGLSGDETFRNPNGVYMKLMELRKYDPTYHGTGLGHGRERSVELDVWAFSEEELKNAARAIRLQIFTTPPQVGSSVSSLVTGVEFTDAPEGALLTRVHVSRERNPKLVRAKKEKELKKTGVLECEACGFDFQKVYGARGQGFIECHHKMPVCELDPEARTKLEDLALLCANCHRMVHSKRPWLTIEQLKALL